MNVWAAWNKIYIHVTYSSVELLKLFGIIHVFQKLFLQAYH